MASRQFRALFVGGSLLLLVAALSACGNDDAKSLNFSIDSMEMGTDQCGVYDIVRDYERADGSGIPASLLLQIKIWLSQYGDREHWQRIFHRRPDFHLLRYIVKDSRYSFVSDCRSKFRTKPLKRYNNSPRDLYAFSSPEPRLLCRITPFSGEYDSGQVISCINTATGMTTFDVEYDKHIIFSFDLDEDQCGVFDIVGDYQGTKEWNYATPNIRNSFRWDRDASLRSRYRNTDWHLLRYIVKDSRYSFVADCRSKFRISTAVEGYTPWRDVLHPHNFYTFSSAEPQLLCRIRRFSSADDSGRVVSCINTATRRTTFKVERQ